MPGGQGWVSCSPNNLESSSLAQGPWREPPNPAQRPQSPLCEMGAMHLLLQAVLQLRG